MSGWRSGPNLWLGVAVPVSLALAGCASMPDVVYNYYPSKALTTVSATQSVDCTSDKTRLLAVSSATIITTYSADHTQSASFLHIKSLGSSWANSDVNFTFSDDGRLKSINASSVGQGEAIIKSSLGVIVAAVGALGAAGKPLPLSECDVIAASGGGKPVSITYGLKFDPLNTSSKDLDVSSGSRPLYDVLKAHLPKLTVKSTAPGTGLTQPATSAKVASDEIGLDLRKIEDYTVDVNEAGHPIASATIAVPTTTKVTLPIPKARLFGKQAFSLTLAESGAILQIGYGSETGATGLLNTLNNINDQFKPPTTAAKAAEIKAQADLIAQQQRLIRCESQPENCEK